MSSNSKTNTQSIKEIKSYIPLAIIVSILCLFSAYIIDIWQASFFYTLFASIQSGSLMIDLLMLSYLILYMAYLLHVYHKALAHPIKMYAYTTAIAVIYMFYKYIVCADWQYTPFSICQIKYLDALYIPCITSFIIFGWICYNQYKQKDKKQKELTQEKKQSGFISDTPSKEDKYKRKKYAQTLSTKLLLTDCSETAFALGIIGCWGAGKTTFMELISSELEDKAICIEFKPWLCNNENELINEYFSQLKSAVSIYDPSVKSQIDNYIKSLIDSSDSSLIHSLKVFISPSRNETTTYHYDEIEQVFKTIKKRFIIFIDDFDRLNADEICAVLKIIRNTSNFPYLTFVVTYDKEYVTNTLEKHLHNPDKYLEKIFNIEITLPAYTKTLLIEELIAQISTHILPIENYKSQITTLNNFFILINKNLTFLYLSIFFRIYVE